jgi:hypothetical protein
MRRAVLTAAILIMTAALPLCAQRGGFRMGPRAGGAIAIRPHGAVGLRSGFGFRRGFAFGHNPRGRVFINRRPFFGHRRFFRQSFFPFGAFPLYPLGFDDSLSYASQPAYVEPDTRLMSEVYRLQAEVDQLRQEQALRQEREQEQYASAAPVNAPRPAPEPRAAAEAPATILVYRDGRKAEIRNYAVVGETLWLLSEQRAQKIPLAELDLAATRKANEERGMEFAVPSNRAR